MHAIMGTGHYENFPVASILCPPALRPAVLAIYHFARTADDLADEGDSPASVRIEELSAYQQDLHAVLEGRSPGQRWQATFDRLALAIRQFDLPGQPLQDLLRAFIQDVHQPRYASREALLGYCRLSANPVGRLLLHLYGQHDERSQAASDAICSALQLINFWQDLSVDLPRRRVYIPHEDAQRHGIDLQAPERLRDDASSRALVQGLCEWAGSLMRSGQGLAVSLPGRAGWELRMVVQGGLRILEKIQRMQYATLAERPVLAPLDGPLLLWRSWKMGHTVTRRLP